MSEKPPSKDEALEALDFIVNVLKEHEKDLDRLVNELGTVADQMGESGELGSKVEQIEEKINALQTDVNNVLKRFSTSTNGTQPASALASKENNTANNEPTQIAFTNARPLLLQCKQWEDFKQIATQAQTVSFTFKETDKTFQVEALKNNHIITYTGETPKFSALMKTWLSKELETPDKKIIEGILATT
jgi:hypothetical protein